MTVGLLGTFGVGKTETWNAMRERRPDIVYFGESVRPQMASFGRAEAILEFMDAVGVGAFELMNVNSLGVTDPQINPLLEAGRDAVIDQVSVGMYGYYLARRKTDADYALEGLLRKMARHYDSLVDRYALFPTGVFPLREDDMRPGDVAAQLKIELAIERAIVDLGIDPGKIVRVTSLAVEDRAHEVISLFNRQDA